MTEFTSTDCYLPIPIKSINRSDILLYAMTQTFSQSGHNGKYSFLQIELPESFIEQDTFLKFVRDEWNIKPAAFRIHKMDPNTYYVFHSDSGRGASINMMLSEGSDSITYFKAGEEHVLMYNIIPLVYELDNYYLINSQAPHGAISGPRDRYLLSISLGIKIVDQPMMVFNEYRSKLYSKYKELYSKK